MLVDKADLTGDRSEYPLVDSHVHWDQIPEEQMDEVIRRAKTAGVHMALSAATGPDSCRRLLHYQQQYPDFLRIGFGLHPEYESTSDDVRDVLRLIEKHRGHICAVGEIGLPYYCLAKEERFRPPSRSEKERLMPFLQIAAMLDLPVWLHAVHERTLPVLEMVLQAGVRRAVFHWLKAPAAIVREIVHAGFHISVTPEGCYRDRDRELIHQVPLTSLLLETDAPWSYGGPFAGRSSEPAMVVHVAKAVSEVKGLSLSQVAQVTTHNLRQLIDDE
jgi:TatD DNase family protein